MRSPNSPLQKEITFIVQVDASVATKLGTWPETAPSPTARILISMPLSRKNPSRSQEKTNLQGPSGPPEDPKLKPCNTNPLQGTLGPGGVEHLPRGNNSQN